MQVKITLASLGWTAFGAIVASLTLGYIIQTRYMLLSNEEWKGMYDGLAACSRLLDLQEPTHSADYYVH
jgi:hypothetical protein